MDNVFFEFCGSQLWDANFTWYTDDPVLAPCFEKTILLWVPAIFLILLLPFECCRISRSRFKHIPWSWINISRIVVVVLHMVISVACLIFIVYQGNNYPADISAPIVQFVTYGVVLVLTLLHKTNGQRISYVLFYFSLLVVLTQTLHFYSHARAYFKSTINNVTIACMEVAIYLLNCAFFILQFFCDKEPLYSEYPKQERPSSKCSASVPSRLIFTWFTPKVILGRKRPLVDSDLCSLDHENSSNGINQNFHKHLINSDKKAAILPALFKTFGPFYLLGSFYKLLQDLIIFVNPQLMRLVIGFEASNEGLWKGILYAVLMLVASFTQMILLNRYLIIMNFTAARINTALISALYRKSLKLSNAARKKSTVGEIINLMAVDAASFKEATISLNLMWSAPLQILIALYFLWNLLGPAVLAGLAVMVLVIPVNVWLVRQNRRLRIRQMKHKDERIKLMNEVLAGIKVLKLYAWELSFEDRVEKIRQKEMSVLKTAAYYNSISSIIFSMTPYMVALASFSAFVLNDEHNVLNAEIAFVSLALFNIMRFPISMMPQILNNMALSAVSIKRMNKFLNNKELDPQAVTQDSSQQHQIVIKNGSFSWDASEDSSVGLHNISLTVAPGALVAVVGSVGAGKSSLLSAILGEMDKLSGTVTTKGSIAYVPQQAWIQNVTLRKNITCVQEFDQAIFDHVVKACALEQDIEMLPGGDMTEIGEKGINLSGGQKQRISLARAVYSQADVYLLDDPLSAVDSHVGKHIFKRVIGPKGILQRKTRVLVTHGVTYLPEADHIVVMKNGRIIERGTFLGLLENEGVFAEFILQYFEQAEDTDDDADQDFENLRRTLFKVAAIKRRLSVLKRYSTNSYYSPKSLMLWDVARSRQKSILKSQNKGPTDRPEEETPIKLIPTEETETGNVRFSVFLYYMKSMGAVVAPLAIIGYVVYQVLVAATNLWLYRWTSDSSTSSGGIQQSPTYVYLGVYAALGIGQAITSVMGNLCMSLGCLLAASWLHANLLQHILRAPMSYFDTTPLGRVINRFSRDIDVLDTFMTTTLSAFLSMALQIVCIFSVITYSTPLFIVVIIPIMMFNIFMQRFFVATSRQLKRLESTSRSPIYSHFSETLEGTPSIRAYGIQEVFITESEKKVDHNQMCNYPNIIALRWLAIHLDLVGIFIVFSAALLAVLYRESIDPGLAGLSITYALQVTGNLNFLVRSSSDVESNMVSVERIREYSQIKQEAAWSVEPKPNPAWPTRGKIKFRNFSIRYREGLNPVLAGVTFTVQPREKVGIVGRTGAGKSSLTLALFRILESAGGSICIDNVDISTVGLQDLRSRLTVIPQDPVLFSGTLRTNLDPFGSQPDSALWRALELANLKPFVSRMPAGLNHPITEGGDNLSVGQKQLICLSRALLRKTKVLILDEATAAVDLETDDIIQRTIRTEFSDCTVLTIAHRLNTIMDYNKILVLEKGKLAEYDSPTSLLRNTNSIFYNMAKDAGIIA